MLNLLLSIALSISVFLGPPTVAPSEQVTFAVAIHGEGPAEATIEPPVGFILISERSTGGTLNGLHWTGVLSYPVTLEFRFEATPNAQGGINYFTACVTQDFTLCLSDGVKVLAPYRVWSPLVFQSN